MLPGRDSAVIIRSMCDQEFTVEISSDDGPVISLVLRCDLDHITFGDDGEFLGMHHDPFFGLSWIGD